MRKLGEVEYLSKENILILKSGSTFDLTQAVKLLNKPVFNEKERKVGEIKEIFGSTIAPYFSVKPRHGVKAEKLVHNVLYAIYGEKGQDG